MNLFGLCPNWHVNEYIPDSTLPSLENFCELYFHGLNWHLLENHAFWNKMHVCLQNLEMGLVQKKNECSLLEHMKGKVGLKCRISLEIWWVLSLCWARLLRENVNFQEVPKVWNKHKKHGYHMPFLNTTIHAQDYTSVNH